MTKEVAGMTASKPREDDTPVLLSGGCLKKFTASRDQSRGQEKVSRSSIDFTVGRLAAGQAVSELDIYENSFGRYRKKDSLSVIKEIHRRFPKDTRMLLVGGLWTITPAIAKVTL